MERLISRGGLSGAGRNHRSMFRGVLTIATALGLFLFLAAVRAAVRSPPEPPPRAPRSGHSPVARDATRALTEATDLERLRARELLFPVLGYDVAGLRDNFDEPRGRQRRHGALDLLAPRGTPVLAVDDGPVVKLFDSVGRGGLSVYQFDPASTYCYYYAHLDRYADGLRDGSALRKGEVLGYVGSTGNAPPATPHLHFAIFKLGPEKQWGRGDPVNAFALWTRESPPAPAPGPPTP